MVEDYCEVISFVLKLSCLYFTRTSVPRNMCRFRLSNTFIDIRTMTSSQLLVIKTKTKICNFTINRDHSNIKYRNKGSYLNICRCRWLPLFLYFLLLWFPLILKLQFFCYTYFLNFFGNNYNIGFGEFISATSKQRTTTNIIFAGATPIN